MADGTVSLERLERIAHNLDAMFGALKDCVTALEFIKEGAVHPFCKEHHASGDCRCAELYAEQALLTVRARI